MALSGNQARTTSRRRDFKNVSFQHWMGEGVYHLEEMPLRLVSVLFFRSLGRKRLCVSRCLPSFYFLLPGRGGFSRPRGKYANSSTARWGVNFWGCIKKLLSADDPLDVIESLVQPCTVLILWAAYLI